MQPFIDPAAAMALLNQVADMDLAAEDLHAELQATQDRIRAVLPAATEDPAGKELRRLACEITTAHAAWLEARLTLERAAILLDCAREALMDHVRMDRAHG